MMEHGTVGEMCLDFLGMRGYDRIMTSPNDPPVPCPLVPPCACEVASREGRLAALCGFARSLILVARVQDLRTEDAEAQIQHACARADIHYLVKDAVEKCTLPVASKVVACQYMILKKKG
jgi:hypothetical protein